jgi:hypothetical protein
VETDAMQNPPGYFVTVRLWAAIEAGGLSSRKSWEIVPYPIEKKWRARQDSNLRHSA